MIAKISSAYDLTKPLAYNLRKVSKNEATVLFAKGVTNNGKNTKLDEVVKEMKLGIPYTARCVKQVFHCSLNPHPKDRLTDDQLEEIAREYMERMGYGEQPYIVFKHSDIAREHIHIVALRVNSNGKKINASFERVRSQRITEDLERKYNLISAKESNSMQLNTHLEKVNASEGELKKKIAFVVRAVISKFAFQSMGEFNAILAQYNVKAEEVNSEKNGKKYSGIVYTATDEKGNKVSIPFPSGKLGSGTGKTALYNKMKKSQALVKLHTENIKTKILLSLSEKPKDINELKLSLSAKGITLFTRYADNGRLYGVTFIDNEKGIALNGSKIGKEFSANAFQKALIESGSKSQDTAQRSEVNLERQTPPNELNSLDEALNGFVQFFTNSFTSGATDAKEAAFQRKLKRKKHQLKRKS